MPTFYGNSPSMDILARMGEIDAKFSDQKIGRTPKDVESLAWGFFQQNFQPPLEELTVTAAPQYGPSVQTRVMTGHPGEPGGAGNQGARGVPGLPGLPGVVNCGNVCDCLDNCDQEFGACCIPGNDGQYSCAGGVTRELCQQYGGLFKPNQECTLTLCPDVYSTEPPFSTVPSSEMSSGEVTDDCNSPDCETETAQTTGSEAVSSVGWTWQGSDEPDSEDPDSASDYVPPTYPTLEPPSYEGGTDGPDSSAVTSDSVYCCDETGLENDGCDLFVDPPSEKAALRHLWDEDCPECSFEDCFSGNICEIICSMSPGETTVTCPSKCGPVGTTYPPHWDDPENSPWSPPSNKNDPWKFTAPVGCCCGSSDNEGNYGVEDPGEICVTVVWKFECHQVQPNCQVFCSCCYAILEGTTPTPDRVCRSCCS